MPDEQDALQIGEFAEMVGLSVPQLRRYDRLLEAVEVMTEEDATTVGAHTQLSSWLHLMPYLPVSDVDRSIEYYQEALGFRLGWRTADGGLAALVSGDIEVLLLVPWSGDAPPPPQSAYVYVEDPDSLCAEYQQAGADVIEPVASRPYGMRDFVVQDPDGHRFRLGRGEERLRDFADYYGLAPEEISVDPACSGRRK